MKRIIYLFLAACITFLFSTESHAQYNWSHFGPEGIGAKTRSIIFDADGNLLAGAAGGGLWKSTNEGLSWFKVTAYNGNPNITSMVRDGNNIYVSTGEVAFQPFKLTGARYESSVLDGIVDYMGLPGGGVYVSTDNGETWSNNNATTTAFPTANYDGPFVGIQKVTLGSDGRIFVASREGLYYSDNNLESLQLAGGSDVFQRATVFDVEVSGDRVFVGTPDSLYMSTDGGDNFAAVLDENLFVNGRLSFFRVEIEVAEVNPDVIYVAGTRNSSNSQLGGVWRSTDRGDTWSEFAPPGVPGFTPLGNTSTDAFVLKIKPGTEDGLILAGQNWFTLSADNGWVQTAQHFVPFALDRNYIPNPIYTVTFHPEDPNILYIGTGTRIFRSDDQGETFYQRTKGYGATNTVSVGSVGLEGQESIIAGTDEHGTILNNNWWREPYNEDTNPGGPPSVKSFGTVGGTNLSKVSTSYLYPGSMIIQGTDRGGVVRSDGSFGGTFERFYGLPLNATDTGTVIRLTGISTSDVWLIDRTVVNPRSAADVGRLVDNTKFAIGTDYQTQFVLDEYIPDSMIARPGDDINAVAGRDQLQALPHYLYFAGSKFIWMAHFALGDTSGLLPRWDRLTNEILDVDEFFTAITTSGDENHIVYAGTSKGRIIRIIGSDNFETYDAASTAFVVDLTAVGGVINNMAGRWITDISANPTDPDMLAITFAGYGGSPLPAAPPSSYVWLMKNASATTTNPNYFLYRTAPAEQAYSCDFVEQENGDVLLLVGTETGVYSVDNFETPNPQNPIVGGVFTRQTPDDFGSHPVMDIYVRKYRAVVRDEETSDFVLYRDNTIFFASHGYGIWATEDAQFSRGSSVVETPVEITVLDATFYPNPTAGDGTLRLDLIEAADVQATLFAVDGRRVQQYVSDNFAAGRHDIQLETASLNPGVYFLEVSAEGKNEKINQTIKVVISK